jgi:hypothetical protein
MGMGIGKRRHDLHSIDGSQFRAADFLGKQHCVEATLAHGVHDVVMHPSECLCLFCFFFNQG